MLATAVSALPSGPEWAFEFKWDGIRALVDISGDTGGATDTRRVTITSRAGNRVARAYPELVAAMAGVGDALLDGEIVAFRDGRPSFELLQSRMHVRSTADARRLAAESPVTFVVFDMLRRYGVDLTARPYSERRATLQRWASEHPDMTVSPYFDDGPATEQAARLHGLEGVVAKRLSSPYRGGERGSDWQKLRFVRSGDFVVAGWEAAADRPGDLSSLVLGCYAGTVLTFAGKVGSGLTAATSRRLKDQLIGVDRCPFAQPAPPSPGRVVHWVAPRQVVEVEYAELTDDGRLRHPVLRGVRPDKSAKEARGDA